MASQIYLVRPAESVHNVTKDFAPLDPPLTELGLAQAAKLADTFTPSNDVAIIYTSPLRRAIQTALAAFPQVLDKQHYPSHSNNGVDNGAQLVVHLCLQENSSLGCDTGSTQAILEDAFPHVDFSGLGDQ